MRAATEGHLPPVMPQGNLVEVTGREVRKGSPGELMVESSPSRQRRPPCKTSKEMSDEAADAAALTYLLTCAHSEPKHGHPLQSDVAYHGRHHTAPAWPPAVNGHVAWPTGPYHACGQATLKHQRIHAPVGDMVRVPNVLAPSGFPVDSAPTQAHALIMVTNRSTKCGKPRLTLHCITDRRPYLAESVQHIFVGHLRPAVLLVPVGLGISHIDS